MAEETTISSGELILGIDTCGPTGSVALARLSPGAIEILGQTELAGRTYSATLICAVREVLAQANTSLGKLTAIVAVSGPGSFTGVRVGLSAVKGLAEAGSIGVVSVSRLEVLADLAHTSCAALDAHRKEIFLRLAVGGNEPREMLVGREEPIALTLGSVRIAVCDSAAAALLAEIGPSSELVHTAVPTAADALRLCAPRILTRAFADVTLLDGHYLRRSDAEIFGEPGAPPHSR